jgi:hypothetical protein
MTAPFGRSGPGLLQRLRPARISPADLREVADAVLPRLATAELRITVQDRRSGGAVVVLEEGEHRQQVLLADLADDMTAAGVPATAEDLAAALTAWVAHRPVTDVAAASAGIAVLDWADPGRTAVAWTVVVPRGRAAVAWTPSAAAGPGGRERIRGAARRRARNVALEQRVAGPVVLWSHPSVPLLATAVLGDPERLLARVAEAGLELPDMHVVVTPQRPVACAGSGPATRLAGQAQEDCVTLPWRNLAGLPWR